MSLPGTDRFTPMPAAEPVLPSAATHATSRPRVVFMGTADLARTVLQNLADDPRWEITLVVAQPDKPVGRGLQLQPPPVKIEAIARGLPVVQPARARDPEFLEQLRALAPEVVVVAAYGQLLPPQLLAIPRRGCLNVHTSLLPRWRGAAPIQWAIAEGDTETGVTVMRMDVGLDTGDILAAERTPILPADTGQTLHDRLAGLGGALVCRVLPAWLAGEIDPVPQPAIGITHARKLTRDDGRIDWSLPAAVLDRRIRAFNPWPGAFTTMTPGPGQPASLLKIWKAAPMPPPHPHATATPGEVLAATGDELQVATGDGVLRLLVVQREGRRRMPSREFLAGGALKPGDRLGVMVDQNTAMPA